MLSNQEEYKRRLAGLLVEINAGGLRDSEVEAYIGEIGTRIVEEGKKKTWTELKQSLTRSGYDFLLVKMQSRGNALVKEGRDKQALAIKALAMSLVGRTQNDPVNKQGEELLDELINRLVRQFQAYRKKHLQ